MKRAARERADAALERLYAEVPELECKGLCYSSCGVIECSVRERERVNEAGGDVITLVEMQQTDTTETLRCPSLTIAGECSVYAVRPMICRLWGAVEGLPCPHGCRPKDGAPMLSDRTGYGLIGDALAAGGPPARFPSTVTGDDVRAWVDQYPRRAARFLAQGRAADRRRTGRQP